MREDIGFYLSYKKNEAFHKMIDGKKIGAVLNIGNSCVIRKNKPFYNIPKDKCNMDTVKLFIDAVANNGPDDAKVYLSKNLKATGTLDFDALKQVFNKDIEYKYLNKVRFSNMPENIVTNSILVMNNEIKNSSIVHVYMVKEPDIYGSWKICGIERE